MKTHPVAGLGWLLVAGIMQGAFPLPMKFAGKWKWEHLWGWYSLLAFLVLPFLTALLTVPHLAQAYSGAAKTMWSILVFGLLWGVGSVLYGLGIDALGMALGFSIMTALTTALGALVPLMVLTPDLLWRRNGLLIMLGNAVTIAGVGICAYAGSVRDRLLGGSANVAALAAARSFPAALTICIIAGALSAMFNFGYAFGEPIVRSATALGATHDDALNAVWLVMLPAGGLINLGYCAHLLRKNRSIGLMREGSLGAWGGGAAMALLWTGSVVVYGWGANALGRLGPTVGWSLWNAILIATTVVCGLATGEWRGVRVQPLRYLAAGIAVLIAGMFVLGMGVE